MIAEKRNKIVLPILEIIIWTQIFHNLDKYFGQIYFNGDGWDRWMKRSGTTMVEHRGRQLSSQLLMLAILTDAFDKLGQMYWTI